MSTVQQEAGQPGTLQRSLPIDPGPRLFNCSPTKLSTWISCPRRFRFAYLDRPMPAKGGPWAHLSYGASTHLALRAWWDLPQRDRTPAAAGGLVTKLWVDEGFRDDSHSKRWCGIASDQVSEYAKQLDPEIDPVGLERLVAMKTPGLAFSGRVDRIDEKASEGTNPAEPSRELVVVDYKTGKEPPNDLDARASQPLALYAEATQRLFRRTCRTVELHHVPSGTVARWTHDEQSVSRHVDRAEQTGVAAGKMAAKFAAGSANVLEDFPAQPGSHCSWCDFRSVCSEGEQASVKRQPWDGLPDS